MKTYQTNENGSLAIGSMNIPQGHRFYVQALAEVEAGEAEILPHIKPAPTKAELDAPHLAYLNATDWYVVRFSETGVVVPDNILKLRSEARESI